MPSSLARGDGFWERHDGSPFHIFKRCIQENVNSEVLVIKPLAAECMPCIIGNCGQLCEAFKFRQSAPRLQHVC